MRKHLQMLLVAAMFLSMSMAYGVGFQLYSESSAEALAVAGAVVGSKNRLSNAWYNPATLTSFDKPAIQAGATALKLSITYDYNDGSDDLQNPFRPTGYLYGVVPMDNGLVLGLSVNAPYGMITEWDNDFKEANMATFTNIRVAYSTISLAWKVNDQLSLAFGFNNASAIARIARNLPASDSGQNKMYMRADDYFSPGFVLSAHYQATEEWGFGAHYQSRVRLDLDGDVSYRHGYHPVPSINMFQEGDVSAKITLPSSLALGVANNSFKDLTLMFDAVWSEWSTYDSLNIAFEHMPGTTTGAKGVSEKPKDWDDSWSFRFGAEYALNENWKIRGGYMYDMCQDNDKYRSAEMPDNNRHLFSTGLSYTMDSWTIDLAYAYLYFEPSKMGTYYKDSTARGKFKNEDVHIVSIGVTKRF